ncbi:MAG: pyridoxamine 5'-phosphate oxidase [Gammaproteobacteria bacterium]|nr:pyridoxamine 5'-phosphate oxidase [Gammaproteobacteria bacterium]
MPHLSSLPIDPMIFFEQWFLEATQKEKDPNIGHLATVGKNCKPSLRIVLLKQYDAEGFVFYTNLGSLKARQLQENPYAALCFYWHTLNKMIRIEGKTEAVSGEEADAYFKTRPRASQIGAWASHQSHPMEDDEALAKHVIHYNEKFSGKPVPRPPFWSGFRVVPDSFEFWQAGDARLHTRVQYSRSKEGWIKKLLYP